MPTPTFSEQMVARLQAVLLANPGASTVNVEGETISFVDCEARLKLFEARVAREQTTRPRVSVADLSCA